MYVESHGGKGLKGCINWGGVVEALRGKRNTMECQNRHHTLRRLNGKIEKVEKLNCLARNVLNEKSKDVNEEQLDGGLEGREGGRKGDRGEGREEGKGGGRGVEVVSSGMAIVTHSNNGRMRMQIHGEGEREEGEGVEDGGERIG